MTAYTWVVLTLKVAVSHAQSNLPNGVWVAEGEEGPRELGRVDSTIFRIGVSHNFADLGRLLCVLFKVPQSLRVFLLNSISIDASAGALTAPLDTCENWGAS